MFINLVQKFKAEDKIHSVVIIGAQIVKEGSTELWENGVLTRLRKLQGIMYMEILVVHRIYNCAQTAVICYSRK